MRGRQFQSVKEEICTLAMDRSIELGASGNHAMTGALTTMRPLTMVVVVSIDFALTNSL